MTRDEAMRFRKAIVEQDILCSVIVFDEILAEFTDVINTEDNTEASDDKQG